MSYEKVDFGTYIYRLLKQIHPDNGLSGDGLDSINNFTKITLKKLMNAVNRVMLSSGGRKTISAREVQTAVRLVFPGELAKHAVFEGAKAVTMYNSYQGEGSKSKGKKAPVSRSKRAGLTFPVTRIQNVMMELATAERKSGESAVYMAGVLEYIIGEILELAGNAARDNHKIRITPRHIKLAILNDEEISKLYEGTLMSGGVALTAPVVRKSGKSRKKSPEKNSKKKSPTKKKSTKKTTKKKTPEKKADKKKRKK